VAVDQRRFKLESRWSHGGYDVQYPFAVSAIQLQLNVRKTRGRPASTMTVFFFFFLRNLNARLNKSGSFTSDAADCAALRCHFVVREKHFSRQIVDNEKNLRQTCVSQKFLARTGARRNLFALRVQITGTVIIALQQTANKEYISLELCDSIAK